MPKQEFTAVQLDDMHREELERMHAPPEENEGDADGRAGVAAA